MFLQFKCCGINNASTWARFDPNLPDSCCVNEFSGCGQNKYANRTDSELFFQKARTGDCMSYYRSCCGSFTSSFLVAGLRDEAGGECGEQDPRHRARRAAAWSHSGKFPTNMNASCGSSCSIRDADSCCRSSESFSLWALRGPSTTMTTVWSEATSGDVLAHEDCCIRIARLIADVFMCNRRSMVLISFYIKI